MQRFLMIFPLALFLYLLFNPLNLSAQQTFYVRADGNDANNGLNNTPAGAFRTLSAAIRAALANGQDADIINLIDNTGNGTTYSINATLSVQDKGLILRSRNNADSGPGNVRLLGEGDFPILSLQNDGQQVLNIQFQASAELKTHLIELKEGSNQVVQNCSFEIPEKILNSNAHPNSPMQSWQGFAIYLYNAQNATLTQNTIRNFRQGIRVEPTVTASITDNLIYYCKGGIVQFGGISSGVRALDIRNNQFVAPNYPQKRNEWDIVFADFQSFALFQNLYTSIATVRNNNLVGDHIPTIVVRPFPIQEQIASNRSVIYVDNTNPAFAAYTLSNSSLTGKDSLGNFYQPFSSLSDAIRCVISGGHIFIKPGVYDQNIIVDKPLIIEVTENGIPIITSLTQNISGGGLLMIKGSLQITSLLNLQSGWIDPGNGKIIVGNSTCSPLPQIIGGSANSFILSNGIGGLQRMCLGVGGITSNVSFPVGSNRNSYTPLFLQNLGSRDTFTLCLRESVLSQGISGTAFTEHVVNRTWLLEETTSGGTNANLQVQWNAAEELNFLRGNCLIAVHNGSFWQPLSNWGTATAPAPFTRSANNVKNLGAIAVRSQFTCDVPSILQIVPGSISFTTAAIEWSPTLFPVEIQIQPSGGSWSTPVITHTSPYTFTNLTPGTSYTVRIRTICLENQIYSEYQTLTFTTENCAPPSNFHIRNITYTSAQGTFDPVLNALTYQVEYRIIGNPSTQFSTAVPSFTLSNLVQGQKYEVCIRSVCVQNQITSSPVCRTFETPLCKATELIQVSNITFTSAEVSWQPVPDAEGYELEYRLVGGNWIPVSGISPVTLAPLQAPANYEVRIRTRCRNAFSEYKSTFFQTPTCRPPLNFATSKIGFTEVITSWSPNPNAVAYELRWRKFGTTAWENQIITQSPPCTIPNLTHNTEYEIQIRSICVENTIYSDWLTTGFKTLECRPPQNILIRNTTYTTAEVIWESVEGVSLYEVAYQIEGSGIWSTPETVSTTQSLLQGLEQGKKYRVRIRSICTPGVLDAESSLIFNTSSCPKVENIAFNNISYTSLTLTWQATPLSLGYEVYYKEADSVRWKGPFLSPINRYTLFGLKAGTKYYVRIRSICITNSVFSDYSVDSAFTNTTCNTQPIVRIEKIGFSSSIIAWNPIPGISQYEISFKFFGQTDPDWYILLTRENPFTLTGLRPDTDYWVRVRGICVLDTVYTEYGGSTFKTKACPEPTNTVVNSVTPYEAQISWQEVPQAIRYQVNYREIGTTRFKLETISSNRITLKNLYPKQCYEAQIRSECSAGSFSSYSPFVQFCTPEGCSPPRNITVSGQVNSALVQWEIPSGSNGTIVFWARNKLPLVWEKATVPAPLNQYRIENLAGNENYLLSLLSQCGQDNSPWSEIIDFVTIGVSRDKSLNKFFSLYPNPTYGTIEILMPFPLGQTFIEITNQEGKIVFSTLLEILEPKTTLNLENLPNGIYLIRISQNGTLFQQKLLKH